MGAMDTSPHGTRTHTGADMYGPSEGLDSPPRSAPSTAPATPLPSPLEQTEYTYDYYNDTQSGFVNDLYFEHEGAGGAAVSPIELWPMDLTRAAKQAEQMDSLPFQRYKRFYGKACLYGTLGCRWKRYQQSKADTHKWELAWFAILVLVCGYVSLWIYYWAICISNDWEDIETKLYSDTGLFLSWREIIISITSIALIYAALLLMLALTHVALGYELYIHKIHKVLLVFLLAGCTALACVCSTEYPEGWSVIAISLQVFGLYIQVSAVVLLTLFSWLIAGQWAALASKAWKLAWLMFYIVIMLLLYISPLFIDSPCVRSLEDLPPKPKLYAHRGNSAYAPENTLEAFKQAIAIPHVIGIESDVSYSLDGVPVLHHDRTLTRTTNIDDVYPDKVNDGIYNFNATDLRRLSSGKWFLSRDPFDNVHHLTEEERKVYANQTIPSLYETLVMLRDANMSFMFDFMYQPHWMHGADTPYRLFAQIVQQANFPPEKIQWMYQENDDNNSYTYVWRDYHLSSDELHRLGVSTLNVNYDTSWRVLRDHVNANISVNVYTVNTLWMYAYWWCVGVQFVTTNLPGLLSGVDQPPYVMTPETFVIIWATVDAISFALIIMVFLIQWHRKHGQLLEPEMASLQVVRHRLSQTRQSKNMKEKLIRAAEGLQESPTAGFVGLERDPSMNLSVTSAVTSDAQSIGSNVTSHPVSSEAQDATMATTEETVSNASGISLKDIDLPADV